MSHPVFVVLPGRNCSWQNSKRISDLMTMLECPVCMDTADRAPIYQCPEGHLLCESCNGRLLDCPQCGHALMNARNRIAEELAEKLEGRLVVERPFRMTPT